MVGGLYPPQLILELLFESLSDFVGYVSLSCKGVQFEARFLSLRKACCPALTPGVNVGQGGQDMWLPLPISLLLNSQCEND